METTLIRVLPSGPNLDPETSRGLVLEGYLIKFFLNFILILIRVVKFRVNI